MLGVVQKPCVHSCPMAENTSFHGSISITLCIRWVTHMGLLHKVRSQLPRPGLSWGGTCPFEWLSLSVPITHHQNLSSMLTRLEFIFSCPQAEPGTPVAISRFRLLAGSSHTYDDIHYVWTSPQEPSNCPWQTQQSLPPEKCRLFAPNHRYF